MARPSIACLVALFFGTTLRHISCVIASEIFSDESELIGGFNSADRIYADEDAISAESVEELFVVRGQKVFLDCFDSGLDHDAMWARVRESGKPVRWFHDGKEVKENLRVTWSATGRLFLAHSITSDSGVWHCSAADYRSHPVRLIVTVPPERPYLTYGGAQLAGGARLTTREGNSLTLYCIVEGGNPTPSISWVLNVNDITHLSKVYSKWLSDEGVFSTVSNITLSKVGKAEHNSTIACIIRHPALPVHVPVPLRLNIEYPPNFHLHRWPAWGSPVREGADMTLLCEIDANPASTPFWMKVDVEGSSVNETQVSSGGWLNLTRVTLNDQSWYKCCTNHLFGRFETHSILINILRGKSEMSIKNSLLLQKVEYNDAAPNLCTNSAENNRGMTMQFLEVCVSDIPTINVNVTKIMVHAGERVMIVAKVCGRQLVRDVTWIPPNSRRLILPGDVQGNITASNLTITKENCHLSYINIDHANQLQSGRWIIVATSNDLASTLVIHLNVTSTSHSMAAATAGTSMLSALPNLAGSLIFLLICVYSNAI